jgi:hypothetical protein
MRLVRYRCKGCGLELLVEARPEKCFCCGSTDMVREGLKERYRRIKAESSTEGR